MSSHSEPSKTKVVRAELERACKDFTTRIAPLGFTRTKKMFWTRRQPLTVDFIHFSRHGNTYGAPINFSVSITAYFGIRVLNDVFPAAIPNGPCSDSLDLRSGGYHLRFNAKSGDTYERCIDDLARFVSEVGEPWFQKFQSVDSLLQLPDSPLRSPEKQLLIDAIEDRAKPENETNSLKILGIKLT